MEDKKKLERIISKEKIIKSKLMSLDPSKYLGLISNISLLFNCLKDYWEGGYKEIPWATITAIAFALLYFINPFDMIPDFIPGVGYIDDSAVIAMVISGIKNDLENYKLWREKNQS